MRAAVAGISWSGEMVAVMTRSTCDGSRPASASASRAATMPRSELLRPGSATLRSLMPVRCRIQASEVSSVLAKVVVGDHLRRYVRTQAR